ncbi:hypothetical protein ABT093_30170 [Kitasatospora sp. NPDC002551]|uniref:hypothetical protein n=1 Tax=unclassified Kitasatospora TaxID=2633591 RepID=UPI00332778C1
MAEDGNWLLDEPCNYSQSEMFFIRKMPGTNLSSVWVRHSNRWLSVDGATSGSHVVQTSFKADLFEFQKLW